MGGTAACSAVSAAGGLSIQRQLRLKRWQPERLHLRVEREAFPYVLRQRFGFCRVARHGKRKRGFDLDALTRGNQLQSCRCCLLRFRWVAVSGLLLSSNRLPDRPAFLAVNPDGGVHCPLGQFPRLAQMTSIGFGVGCERKSRVFFGLARIPLLLL